MKDKTSTRMKDKTSTRMKDKTSTRMKDKTSTRMKDKTSGRVKEEKKQGRRWLFFLNPPPIPILCEHVSFLAEFKLY